MNIINKEYNKKETKRLTKYNLIKLEKSFDKNTLIKCENNNIKEIKDIKLGEKLFNNTEVIGIVKIFTTCLNNNIDKCKNIKYNLLTNTKNFNIFDKQTGKNKVLNHYNDSLEQYL
jgi:hypothetical protein